VKSKRRINSILVALPIAVILWLGLSPRWAGRAYEEFLLPRVRPDVRLLAERVDAVVEPVPFNSCAAHHRLQGMFYRHATSSKVIIFFAGRSSNLAKVVVPAREMLRCGASVFVFEYRGFGSSPGKPSTKSVLEDGLAAYAAVLNLGYKPEDIILYGESLGTAVAAHVADRMVASGLIMQSGFSSLERAVKDLAPIFRLWPSALFSPQMRMASEALLRKGHPPLLLIHGDNDDVVGHEHSIRLARAAGENTTLTILKGAGHFHVHERDDWREAVTNFVASL
jgi:alpha-beta hydrolase superfamily lysophospholipase